MAINWLHLQPSSLLNKINAKLLTIGIISVLLALGCRTTAIWHNRNRTRKLIFARHYPYQGYGLITAAILTLIIGSAVGIFMIGWWI